jgi:hypothetical protein
VFSLRQELKYLVESQVLKKVKSRNKYQQKGQQGILQSIFKWNNLMTRGRNIKVLHITFTLAF